MGNRLGGEGAGAGAIVGFVFGGPLGAAIGAGVGGAAGSAIESGGKAISEEVQRHKATCQGNRVYAEFGSRSSCSNQNYTHRYNMNDKIDWYETRACRILHGSVSWIAQSAWQMGSGGQGDYIDHWWLTIKTRSGKYYQLQFRGGSHLVELRSCSSYRSCNLQGLYEANKTTGADIWKEDKYSYTLSKNSTKTIGDVVEWIKSDFSANYDIVWHNCQDLCKAFYKKF